MAKDPTQGPITRYDETGNPKIMIEPDAEDAQSEEREMVEEAEVQEEEMSETVMEFHPHHAPNPLSYADAQKALEDLTYAELKELCAVDGLSPARSKAHTISVLLEYWFAPVDPVIPEELSGEFSVRIKRIKGLL